MTTIGRFYGYWFGEAGPALRGRVHADINARLTWRIFPLALRHAAMTAIHMKDPP